MQWGLRVHDRHRPAIALDEPGAQDLVAEDDLHRRTLERRDIEHAAQPPASGHDEPDAPGDGLAPDSLLFVGERRRTAVAEPPPRLPRLDPRGRRRLCAIDQLGHPGHRQLGVERVQLESDIERVAYAGGDHGGRRGVTAELEERNVGVDRLDFERARPQGGHQLLGVRAKWPLVRRRRGRRFRFGQPACG